MNEVEANTIGQVQPTVVVIEKTSRKRPIDDSYKSKHVKIFGEIHIFCAALAFLNGVFLVLNHEGSGGFSSAGTGIWCSVFFFLTGGALSICSAKHGSSCRFVSILVIGIISAFSAFILIVFSILALDQDRCSYSYSDTVYTSDYSYNSRRNTITKVVTHCADKVRVGLNVLQIVVGVIELVLAIVSSSISCKATCCRDEVETFAPSNRVMTEDQLTSLGLPRQQMSRIPSHNQPSAPLEMQSSANDKSEGLPKYEDLEAGKGNHY